ncbi:hypothetical protein Tco_0652503 [Tanacetum coccineum]|uniref:Uncharacterized protein n=1 Tax=Tanacetum coccineum TaxID=301880 RepID=A0ABQ4WXU9_9ASTR
MNNNNKNILDAELIPVNEQVKIGISNFRIALEKTQPDVIYKFWYTVAYDVTAKSHFFKIDDQRGCSKTIRSISALRVNNMYQPWRTFLTMMKAIAFDCLRLPMLRLLLEMVTANNVDFANLIWE